jgi:hypothetical protein
MKGKQTMNPDDDIEEAAAQMDEDFEDYKKKMAVGAYPEAADVEEDVKKMQEKTQLAQRKRTGGWRSLTSLPRNESSNVN